MERGSRGERTSSLPVQVLEQVDYGKLTADGRYLIGMEITPHLLPLLRDPWLKTPWLPPESRKCPTPRLHRGCSTFPLLLLQLRLLQLPLYVKALKHYLTIVQLG